MLKYSQSSFSIATCAVVGTLITEMTICLSLIHISGLSHGSVSIGASETALNIYLLDRLKTFHMA